MKPRFFAGFFIIPLFVLFSTGCSDADAPDISFYHWKSALKLRPAENEALHCNDVKQLYVKYFDVVKEDRVKPVSMIRFNAKPSQQIVPVIFIKNNVFAGLTVPENDSLVNRILKLISEINTANQLQPDELQFDCDWNETTRENYFQFLETVKKQSDLRISATIRLHQIKYKERTGVPPVEEGVLMYYNIGKITADTLNSIYKKEIADKYIEYLKVYPLHLDIALPVFSWGVQSREGKVTQLVNKMNETDFLNDSFFRRVAKQQYIARQSCFKGGYYFMKDDQVNIESVSETQLLEMAEDISRNIKFKPRKIIYYDLDSINLKRYDEKIFSQISGYFN